MNEYPKKQALGFTRACITLERTCCFLAYGVIFKLWLRCVSDLLSAYQGSFQMVESGCWITNSDLIGWNCILMHICPEHFMNKMEEDT